jgi:lipopolysaccharide/colanic/teichoic acid biosynthesis glycosyltransferase
MIYKIFVKRFLDLFFALLFLLLFWWLLAIIALIIVCTDGRPVLFTQERIGQHGHPFRIYKFRSMVKNAEAIGPKATETGDKRITPIGAVLRKTSLDELPQIFNLIKGNMSIVGFRPGVRENYAEQDFQSGMFDVKPGITGYAQVHGRSDLTLEQKRGWELKYVQDISFRTDCRVLFETVKVVLIGRGSF